MLVPGHTPGLSEIQTQVGTGCSARMGSWKGEPQLVPADRIRLAVLHQGLVRPRHRGAVYRGGPVLRGWGGRRERLIRLPDDGAAEAGAPPALSLPQQQWLGRRVQGYFRAVGGSGRSQLTVRWSRLPNLPRRPSMRSWIRRSFSSSAAWARTVSVSGLACMVHWPQLMLTTP